MSRSQETYLFVKTGVDTLWQQRNDVKLSDTPIGGSVTGGSYNRNRGQGVWSMFSRLIRPVGDPSSDLSYLNSDRYALEEWKKKWDLTYDFGNDTKPALQKRLSGQDSDVIYHERKFDNLHSHSLNKMEMTNQNPVNVETNQNVITDATTKYIGPENQLQNQNSDKLTFNNVLECCTIGGILLNQGISVWSYSQKSKDNRQFLQDVSKANKIQLDPKNVQLGRNARLFQQALKHKEETKPKRADNI